MPKKKNNRIVNCITKKDLLELFERIAFLEARNEELEIDNKVLDCVEEHLRNLVNVLSLSGVDFDNTCLGCAVKKISEKL